MTPHTTPPLAQQLRSIAASAPTLHRPALAAAADAVEELSKLRAERDEAQRISAQLRTETGERIYRLEQALVEALKERDEALADATALAERCDNLAADAETELKAAYAERDAAHKQVAELTAERDSATLGTLGFVISALREERDEARALLHRFEVSANTVAYCYTKRPENFAAALRDLRECADAALKETK